jgi:hypothetical protein
LRDRSKWGKLKTRLRQIAQGEADAL